MATIAIVITAPMTRLHVLIFMAGTSVGRILHQPMGETDANICKAGNRRRKMPCRHSSEKAAELQNGNPIPAHRGFARRLLAAVGIFSRRSERRAVQSA